MHSPLHASKYHYRRRIVSELWARREYPKAISNPGNFGLAKVDTDEFGLRSARVGEKAEACRPFLGERLWTMFWAYRAVIGRLCLKVLEGRDKGKIPPWRFDLDGERDEYVIKLLQLILSDEEIKLIPLSIGVRSRLLGLCEQKILLEMEARISGRHVADLSIDEGRRVRDVLQRGVEEQRHRALS